MNKLKCLREELLQKGIDGVIVLDELNQYYLSDFQFSDGLLVITKDAAHLITDFRYYEKALAERNPEFSVVTPKDRWEYIKEALSDCKTVGFEGGFVSYSTYLSFKDKLPEHTLVSVENMLSEMRQIKSPEEIAIIQKAQDIADGAFSEILSKLSPDMTEQDVAVEIEYAMRRRGAEGFSFDTIAVSGDASALPHGTPRCEKLKRGFLTMDFGAKYKGYCSDMTRTVVIGKADADIKKLYNTVLSAQLAAIDFLREGVDAGEADKIARDIIDSNPEYKGAFGHSLGHSVGLNVHETPTLSPRSFGRNLRVGEILTVEPGIYLFGKYGCRIEDMVCIEKNGVYNFTHSTKELIEIY